ncbi:MULTISPECIES: hypothetical protein [unclassified Pseudonocardia]|uniref:hypothetical protein n=1 Tax=unclassified Pseudonocardia TaxID=2619320 RepID=UPI001CF70C3C|nr:hypothetical protein [Pseudonocardia sp. ICBG601]
MDREPLSGSIGPPLRTALDQARADLLATLSVQVDGLAADAARRAGRAGDVRWWTAALDGPARTLDDAWARRSGPVLRRRAAAAALRHQGAHVTHVTHGPSPSCGGALVAAAARALAVAPGRERGAWSGAVLSGSAVSVLSLLVAGARLLPAAGPGVLPALAGLVLLVGALVAARVRTVRSTRDRALARRVRDAVLVAADRELLRWISDAERSPTGWALPQRAPHPMRPTEERPTGEPARAC